MWSFKKNINKKKIFTKKNDLGGGVSGYATMTNDSLRARDVTNKSLKSRAQTRTPKIWSVISTEELTRVTKGQLKGKLKILKEGVWEKIKSKKKTVLNVWGWIKFWCKCLKRTAPTPKVRERNRTNKNLVQHSPYDLKTHYGDLKDTKKNNSRGHMCGGGSKIPDSGGAKAQRKI